MTTHSLIKPKRRMDRLRLRLRGYIKDRPKGVDEIKKCPSCGAKAYGNGRKTGDNTRPNAAKICAACGYNDQFGPQGPPPDTRIEQHPIDVTQPLAI